jgi:tagatose 1,6-diphosphate aldolase
MTMKTMGESAFEFLDPGDLVDGELRVVLARCNPADPVRQWVPSYDFDLIVNGQEVGEINFRARNTPRLEMYGGHFAYSVLPEHRGHHYAARGVKLLLSFASRHGFKTIWITCNPDNGASRRTCELIGCSLVEIVPLPPDSDMYQEGEREKCRYRIDL